MLVRKNKGKVHHDCNQTKKLLDCALCAVIRCNTIIPIREQRQYMYAF